MIHLKMNCGNSYYKKFFHKVFDKSLVKDNKKKYEITYSTTCNLETPCLWSLNLD